MKQNQVVIRVDSISSALQNPFQPQVPWATFSKAEGSLIPSTLSRTAMIPLTLTVSTEEHEINRIPQLAKQSDVLAVAPAIPMRLIKPDARSSTGDLAPRVGVDWGIQAVGADTSPFTGKGVRVAVLDTGIDANHVAFKGVNLIEKDFTGDGNGDLNGHGTHCAGTIFGRDVNGYRIGVARGIDTALIGKVLDKDGSGSSDQIVRAIQWALDEGAHIISMSLGMDFPGYVKALQERGVELEPATSLALEGYRANVTLFERLTAFIRSRAMFLQSSVIVAAAGNESRSPRYQIAVSPPAVADGIISVAALGKKETGKLAVPSFSNIGANVAAPGVSITSAAAGQVDPSSGHSGGLITMSGTSMAAPCVAGVTALWAEKILSSNGILNPLNLTAQLIASATTSPLEAGFTPISVGTGLVRAPQS